jgi:hypothetical protein
MRRAVSEQERINDGWAEREEDQKAEFHEQLQENLDKAREWLEMEKRRNAPPHIRFFAMEAVGKAQRELADSERLDS